MYVGSHSDPNSDYWNSIIRRQMNRILRIDALHEDVCIKFGFIAKTVYWPNCIDNQDMQTTPVTTTTPVTMVTTDQISTSLTCVGSCNLTTAGKNFDLFLIYRPVWCRYRLSRLPLFIFSFFLIRLWWYLVILSGMNYDKVRL